MKSLFLSFVFAVILAISPTDTYSGGGDGVPKPDPFLTESEYRVLCGFMECWIAGEYCDQDTIMLGGEEATVICYIPVIYPD